MNDETVVCIHGVNQDLRTCPKCLAISCQKLGYAFNSFAIPLKEAGKAMQKMVDAVPQETWDMIDEEIKKRDREAIWKIFKEYFLTILFVLLCGGLALLVTD